MNLSILSPRQKTAWELKEQGFTYKQIAAEMGITYQAARQYIKNAELKFIKYQRLSSLKSKTSF